MLIHKDQRAGADGSPEKDLQSNQNHPEYKMQKCQQWEIDHRTLTLLTFPQCSHVENGNSNPCKQKDYIKRQRKIYQENGTQS